MRLTKIFISNPKRSILAVSLCITILSLSSCQENKIEKREQKGSSSASNLSDYIPEVVDFNLHIRPLLSDRCFACHGPDVNKRESGYRLDVEEAAFLALKDQPNVFGIIPHDTKNSEVINRINSENSDEVMPPPASNLTLSDNEKQLITKWISQGAQWKKHWSFIPVAATQVPVIKQTEWAQNEVDNFIISKMNEKGLSPSKRATKERLLRRASFDLTGLPPSDDLRDSFLSDNSKAAFEKVIEKLMASPSYGEHMTTSWLDLSRYSDSHGYQDDLERIMWPWRDWVIKAYNDNMSYKTFITWQLAGDLLPNPTKEQILATGFNRNHKITQEGGVVSEEYRAEYVTDRTNTFGKAMLGLTLECAKCHDHKYDPLSQEDYFSVYAFFNSVPEKGKINYGEIPAPKIKITEQDLSGILNFVNAANFKGKDLSVMVMGDSVKTRPTYILTRGQYDQPGNEVNPNTPSSIKAFGTELSKDRLGLAKWLFSADHPLTSRVAVNRMWLSFFGKGIVASVSDFGNQGNFPSHPELLDYLAKEFMDSNWDVQALQKKIMLSATYQQTSKVTAAILETDPENIWLSRGPRYRMTFEMIRDNILSVSGLLNDEIGGPSVKPYQPNGLWAETTSGQGLTQYIQDNGSALYRRSLYTFWKRTVPPPAMVTFDAASRDLCEVIRQKTNTPLQALVMMNDPQILEASRVLAYSVIKSTKNQNEGIEHAFEKILGRTPSIDETSILNEFFSIELERFTKAPETAKTYLNIGQYEQEIDTPEAAAYMSLINTIFNLDEAISKT